MKTLLTLFSKERSELQAEIEQAANAEQVVKLVQNRLDILQKNYIGDLSVVQVRLAAFFLDTLRQSIGTLTATNEARVFKPKPEQISISTTKLPANKIILKLLQGLIGISILGSLFSLTQETPGAWMGILLMLVLVGLEVVLQLDKGKLENGLELEQSVGSTEVIVQIDSKIIIDHIADALNTIDLAVAAAEQVKKPLDSGGLEELPELLNVVQRLIGASFLEKPQMAIELTKLLPQILMEQGIRVQIYRPNQVNSGREYFDFEPNIDRSATDYVTITPALFKGDRLLRRGRVIEPAYSEARE